MTRTFLTLTAAASIAATSALAVTTPEDKALNAALRNDQVAPIAEAEYVKSQSAASARSSIATEDGYVFLSQVDAGNYDEDSTVGKR
ncbi:hypothetical protein DZK27_12055 [Rhodobacteraceae bacterium 63075]|nr:hypothetical protein DZK27_12055 [Rhodobacteraceae bacterium 63075]